MKNFIEKQLNLSYLKSLDLKDNILEHGISDDFNVSILTKGSLYEVTFQLEQAEEDKKFKEMFCIVCQTSFVKLVEERKNTFSFKTLNKEQLESIIDIMVTFLVAKKEVA